MQDQTQGHGDDRDFGQSRREFLGALSAALGVTLAADLGGLEGFADSALGLTTPLPSGYRFHRVYMAGQNRSRMGDIDKILPGVMINDRSEVIFHAVERSGERAVYRMRVGRGEDPQMIRGRLIVRTGQKLP